MYLEKISTEHKQGDKMDENTIKLFQSKASDEWETPQDLFDKLNEEFNFDLDVCASLDNAKMHNFYTIKDNALQLPWNGRIWCNPPYSKVKEFLIKAHQEINNGNCEEAVFLTFANTDTKWFHNYVYNKAEIRFIKGRLKFKGYNKDGKLVNNSAMRPSILIILHRT